jgi:hypothetical protein
MLTFIAEYPDDSNIRDGMMLRIKEIDVKYEQFDRIYLDISLVRKRRNKDRIKQISSNLKVYYLNFFSDFSLIYKLLKDSERIYIQAIYNYIKVLVFINVIFKSKDVALDLHGAIPEELLYNKRRLYSSFYNWVEKMAFKRTNHFIHVTRAMKLHFKVKYPEAIRSKYHDYVLGIFTTLNAEVDTIKLDELKKELFWDPSQVWIIYSGGTQQWQNVSLMLETIKKMPDLNYRYLFLTGHLNVMRVMIEHTGLSNKIKLVSVAPDDLKYYYSLAHYGMILRDSTIVNKVSNPTKLSEYLAFGITPIVLNPDVGDYFAMGYDYITLEDLTTQLKCVKSIKNKELFNSYIAQMNAVKLPFMN